MRFSLPLLRQLPPQTRSTPYFSPKNHATYSIGLSYASKNSPPFVPPDSQAPTYGFAGRRDPNGLLSKVTAFVEESLARRAGRGVLDQTLIGGWDPRIVEETRRWGAGEDFFCIADREWTVSAPSLPGTD